MSAPRRIVLVGAGALGSHFAQFARNATQTLDTLLFVVDHDRVERKNVLSQFHARSTVGKSKMVALQQTMDFLFGRKLYGASNKLVEENAKVLLGGASLIVDCLDNAEGRRLIQRFARESDTPCVHGALAADGAFGRIVWDERFAVDEEGGAGAPTCEGGEHLPFVAVVAGYLALAAREFLSAGRKVGFEVSPLGGAPRPTPSRRRASSARGRRRRSAAR